jgi:hypothetical protein
MSKSTLISAIIMGNTNEILKATPSIPIEMSSEIFSILYAVIISYIKKEKVNNITIAEINIIDDFLLMDYRLFK